MGWVHIDYAIMEKTQDSVVIPMVAGWNDVGAWSSLWEVTPKNKEGNVLKGDVLTVNSHNSYIYVYAEQGLVATVGINDMVVVQTKEAVLVAAKDAVQDIKKVVSALKASNRSPVFVTFFGTPETLPLKSIS